MCPADHSISASVSSVNSGTSRRNSSNADRELEAGQARADAPVDSHPEREVAVGLAVEDDLVGIRERALVAVRRRERDQDHLVGPQLLAPELDVVDHDAADRHGAEHAEELLDRGRDQAGFLAQSPLLLGVPGQVEQRRRERSPRRVDAGGEQLATREEHLEVVESLAFDLDVREVADEVVARRHSPLREERAEVAEDALGRGDRVGFAGVLDHRPGPAGEGVLVLGPEAEQLADHGDGHRAGEAVRRVAGAAGHESLDEADRGVTHDRLERGDAGRHECRCQQPLEAHVFGRVELQRRDAHVAVAEVAGDRAVPRRERLGVVRDLGDVVVAGDDPEPLVGGAPRDRALGAQRCEHPLGVGRVPAVVVVEVDDGAIRRHRAGAYRAILRHEILPTRTIGEIGGAP